MPNIHSLKKQNRCEAAPDIVFFSHKCINDIHNDVTISEMAALEWERKRHLNTEPLHNNGKK